MDAQESQQRFQQAQQLFQQGDANGALQQLKHLQRAFPNHKEVLHAIILCYEKLNRKQEAIPLCQDLMVKYQDPRAQEIMARLSGVVAMANVAAASSGGGAPAAMEGGVHNAGKTNYDGPGVMPSTKQRGDKKSYGPRIKGLIRKLVFLGIIGGIVWYLWSIDLLPAMLRDFGILSE